MIVSAIKSILEEGLNNYVSAIIGVIILAIFVIIVTAVIKEDGNSQIDLSIDLLFLLPIAFSTMFDLIIVLYLIAEKKLLFMYVDFWWWQGLTISGYSWFISELLSNMTWLLTWTMLSFLAIFLAWSIQAWRRYQGLLAKTI
ncbi:hypothetical protein TI03_02175 [Achromatium sp. WMS1]|nr:hypothetical protein TI03_02175 [Achromatium sp. WMS1]